MREKADSDLVRRQNRLLLLEALRQHGTTFPVSTIEAAQKADGIILGPVSHNDYPPVAQGGLNPSGELRKRLDLYGRDIGWVADDDIEPAL